MAGLSREEYQRAIADRAPHILPRWTEAGWPGVKLSLETPTMLFIVGGPPGQVYTPAPDLGERLE
jgi:hypothetical protein